MNYTGLLLFSIGRHFSPVLGRPGRPHGHHGPIGVRLPVPRPRRRDLRGCAAQGRLLAPLHRGPDGAPRVRPDPAGEPGGGGSVPAGKCYYSMNLLAH